MGFVHLHLHTEYSLLDGACRIEQALDAAKAMGQTALAITDHGAMYGVIDFYKAAQKRGIKPIVGCEVYVAKRTRFDKVHAFDAENRHLVLLCKNETGYKNLITLVSQSWTEGFYNTPRVDLELLRKHSDGLIALSACLAGEIPRAILAGDLAGARAAALRYREIFGADNFYLELQDHGLPEQKRVLPQLIQLAQELSIPLVATNDCHYIAREDSRMHKVLLCIQTGRTVDDPNAMEFGSDEFYMKSEAEMRELFPEYPEAFDNTLEIAARCNLEIEFGKTKLPRFEAPGGEDSTAYFRRKCQEGLREKYGKHPDPAVLDRLAYELDVIEKMGYVNYYLIVNDYVQYAKSVGIPVGPGRGSGAGSLAAYCIGITGIDPIRYQLLFERFLNPERVSMPDFDIDFSDERRQEMIDYVVRKYGSDRVAQIVAFDTMAARAAVRDVGRALAIPYAAVDSVAKLIPRVLKVTLDGVLQAQPGSPEYAPDFRARYEADPQTRELIDMARKIEGMPRHTTTHAAGVVITDRPVRDYVPLAKNDEATVTQYTMTALDELGLIKMDFLGLRNLSVIDDAVKMIRRTVPDCDIEKIPEDDPAVFAMISAGQTVGVFQFESPGMKRLLIQSRPESIEDLIAVISLFRPGPMSFIPTYVENRHHPERVRYRHPKLAGILGVTYGCVIYQEQVMQICRELAGYSLGRADVVRRAMSKKKADVMERERQIFIYGLTREDGTVEVDGCIRRGVDEDTAKALWSEMESFASYAFNKSHAAAYSVVAYRTAWLKCHYPREYMAALLTSVLGDTDKVVGYIAECTRLGIRVLPPHVNESQNGFSVSGRDIRFGLQAVKNLGKGFIDGLIREREFGGKFESFYAFCKRMYGKELNRRALESLVQCGALDHLGNNRKEMLYAAGGLLDTLDETKRRNVEGQIGFFDLTAGNQESAYSIKAYEEFPESERLAMEKDVTGLYLSGHPMAPYLPFYAGRELTRTDALSEEDGPVRDGDRVTVLGMVVSVKFKTTKAGGTMAFAVLEDCFGSVELLLFPNTLSEYGALLTEGKAVRAYGRVSSSENRGVSLVCERLLPPPSLTEPAEPAEPAESAKTPQEPQKSRRPGLYLRISGEEAPAYRKAMQYLAIFDGTTPLYVFCEDTQKLKAAPAGRWVDVNPVLLRELKKLLGEKNVALRE